MEKEKELKKCPFCGGEPEITQRGTDGIIIKCTICLVKFEQKVVKYKLEWLENKMIERWNERQPNK